MLLISCDQPLGAMIFSKSYCSYVAIYVFLFMYVLNK